MIYPYYKPQEEEFRQIGDSVYLISNLGRVKNSNTGRFLKSDPSKQYTCYRLYDNRLKKINIINVARMMCEIFYGELPEGYQAHHNSLLTSDNSLENITPLSPEDHRKAHKAIDRAILEYPCLVFDVNDNLVAEYDDVYIASNELNIPCRKILSAIKNETLLEGYYFETLYGVAVWK